ncbi:MAG: pilus assembly protein [Afipia sp.]|nr:pilus assembly protein [Afipia sp.]
MMSPGAINRSLRKFRRNQRGSAAVEFAFIAPMFFALIFAIIETSIVFFAQQVLETGTQDSARLMLTHQAQDSGMTQAAFKQDLCNRVSVLMTCANLYVDVKSYSSFSTVSINDPVSNCTFVNNFTYQSSNPGDTVVVRAFYQWPLFVTKLGYNITNIGCGTSNPYRLLAATAAFQVEP